MSVAEVLQQLPHIEALCQKLYLTQVKRVAHEDAKMSEVIMLLYTMIRNVNRAEVLPSANPTVLCIECYFYWNAFRHSLDFVKSHFTESSWWAASIFRELSA